MIVRCIALISVDTIKDAQWIHFLDRNRNATIYHTPKWKDFLQETFGYKPFYIFLKNDSDELVGLLPFFYVRSKITGNRISCLPFAHECGYIGETKGSNSVLINQILQLNDRLDPDFIEIRAPIEGIFQESQIYSTYILRLDALEQGVSSVSYGVEKNVRRSIQKAQKLGVSVEVSSDDDDIKYFYELNCLNKRSLGVPAHPLKFLANLRRILNGNARLYISKFNSEIVGCGLMIYYKDTVLYGYGAAHPGRLRLHPYHAILWKAILDASSEGYKRFDFGRVSRENTGLANFKKRWGSTEKILKYSSYPNPLKSNRSGLKYRLGTRFLKKTPLPVYKITSNLIFRNFG